MDSLAQVSDIIDASLQLLITKQSQVPVACTVGMVNHIVCPGSGSSCPILKQHSVVAVLLRKLLVECTVTAPSDRQCVSAAGLQCEEEE